MKITKPGIYEDFPIADYFADPCPTPSLTQSVAKILIERSPLHAWHAHPRLNPNFERDEDTKYDVGNIAHTLMIGRGKKLSVIDFDDWRTKAAQAARVEAASRGELRVLRKHYDIAVAMVEAAREQIDAAGHPVAFRENMGSGELAIAWREDATWFRSLIDWRVKELPVYYDYKTTGMSCAPHVISERPGEMGWDIQAAMHERGLDILDPQDAGRRMFFFVAQEDEPPYALTIVEISEADMTLGRKKLAMAIDIWNRCMAAGQWPGYPAEVVRSHPRGWTETKWLEREAQYAEREPVNILAGG